MKNIKFLILILTLSVVAVSCETYDDYESPRAAVAGFTLPSSNVKVPADGSREKALTIFVSAASDVERTFKVEVVADQTEVAAENYSFDPNVVIPPNERSGDFILTAMDVSLTSDKTPLTLAVKSGNGIVPGGTITLSLFK